MGQGSEGFSEEAAVPLEADPLSLDIARRTRIETERAYYLSDEGFLDFARDSGAAPNAVFQPHGRYAQELITWYGTPDPANPKLINYRWKLVLWPRGSFKSTVFNIAHVAWLIAKNPNWRILLCSETGRQARKIARAVMKIIDSEWFRELFGVHRNNREWALGNGTFTSSQRSPECLHFKEPTLAAAGVGETQTGAHWDFIFFDDVVSKENTRTAESIESTWEWLGEMLAQLDPGCRLFVIGTLHHYADIYCKIQADPDIRKLFDVSVFAWRNDGVLFFPNRLTETFIDRQRTILTPRMFACFYENKPMVEADQCFKPGYFRTIKDEDIPRSVWTYLLTDFAFVADERKSGGKKHDRTAFWVVSLDANRVAYVLDFWCGRWKASDSVRVACTLWERFQWANIRGITLEETTYNEVLSSVFEEVRRQTSIRPRFIPISGRSQEIKDMRIESIEPRFRNGDIWFAYSLREQVRKWNPMFKEMTEWPFTGHDDIPDAISDLDKTDADGRFLLPGPPHGWQQAVTMRNQPTMIDGRFNPDRGYDPRRFNKQQQHVGDDLWQIESSPRTDDDLWSDGKRSHDNIWRP